MGGNGAATEHAAELYKGFDGIADNTIAFHEELTNGPSEIPPVATAEMLWKSREGETLEEALPAKVTKASAALKAVGRLLSTTARPVGLKTAGLYASGALGLAGMVYRLYEPAADTEEQFGQWVENGRKGKEAPAEGTRQVEAVHRMNTDASYSRIGFLTAAPLLATAERAAAVQELLKDGEVLAAVEQARQTVLVYRQAFFFGVRPEGMNSTYLYGGNKGSVYAPSYTFNSPKALDYREMRQEIRRMDQLNRLMARK